MRAVASIQVWIFAAICGVLWNFHREVIAIALVAGHIALNGQGVDALGLDSLEQMRLLRAEILGLRKEIARVRHCGGPDVEG